MTKAYFLRLFAYDRWANERMHEALGTLTPLLPDAPPARQLSHIIAAQQVWLTHVTGGTLDGGTVWPDTDPGAWPALLDANHDAWQALCERREVDFEAVISYTGLRGEPYTTPLHEIITHVIIHGQHHRAQLAQHLRAWGHTPPPTDFIAFALSVNPA